MAAFVGDKSKLAVISNFEDVHGVTSAAPLPEMKVSWEAYRNGDSPVVVVTGNKRAAPAPQRHELAGAIATAGEDSGQVRQKIREFNRWAALHNPSPGDVSEECTVASLDSSGSGSQILDPTPGIELLHVANGFFMFGRDLLASLGAPDAQVVGASFGTNKPTSRRPAKCHRILYDLPASGYEITEVIHGIDVDCTALGIDVNDIVLGSHSLPDDRTHSRYWRWRATNEDDLEYLNVEPTMHVGGCINTRGDATIVVGEIGQTRPMVVSFRDGAERSRHLEVPAGMGEPMPRAMNLINEICGSISINRDNSDGLREQPAFWDEVGELHLLADLKGGTHGRAVHINRHGQVLVWVSYGIFGSITVLWSPSENEVRLIPGEIIPCFLADDGRIIGFDRRNGRDAPVVSDNYSDWEPLSLPNGYNPGAYNNVGAMAGHVSIDGFGRAWVMQDDQKSASLLPTWSYHNAVAQAMNASGKIVGQLAADHEQHVVLWSRSERPR